MRAIAFDVFGTLLQIGDRRSPYRQLLQWMHVNGRTPQPDDAAKIMSSTMSIDDAAKMFGMMLPDDLLAVWNADIEAELLSIQPFPETLPVMMRLCHAGYRIGLCSDLATPYGGPVMEQLPTLDAYALSYQVGAVKPDPKIYQYLLDQFGCDADEVLFIGDSPSADVDGLSAVGMTDRLINRKVGQTLDDVLSEFDTNYFDCSK